MGIYVLVNLALGLNAWDKYPFILLNLFLSMKRPSRRWSSR